MSLSNRPRTFLQSRDTYSTWEVLPILRVTRQSAGQWVRQLATPVGPGRSKVQFKLPIIRVLSGELDPSAAEWTRETRPRHAAYRE